MCFICLWFGLLLFLVWFYFVFLVLRGSVVVLGLCLCTEEAFKVERVGKERIWNDVGEETNMVKMCLNLKIAFSD